jgi:NAD(P)-dependent dehydrogenase (short-subunit alcohol dehydrogenase family)
LSINWTIICSVYFRRFFQGPKYTKPNRIDGKVVIITGSNTGIGKETALELAKRGGRVYMACRDMAKCEASRQEIVELSNNQNVFSRELDLSSLESVRKFANK